MANCSNMNNRSSLALLATMVLASCSYGHGVARLISFENEIADFSCIDEALNDLGYKTTLEEYGVAYEINGTQASASFWYAREAGSGYRKDKIAHSINFGSPPASCSEVRPAGEIIAEIEAKVLGACQLVPVDVDEKIRCIR